MKSNRLNEIVSKSLRATLKEAYAEEAGSVSLEDCLDSIRSEYQRAMSELSQYNPFLRKVSVEQGSVEVYLGVNGGYGEEEVEEATYDFGSSNYSYLSLDGKDENGYILQLNVKVDIAGGIATMLR